MTIEYIQRLHQGGTGGGRGPGQVDLALSQKEWATDLTTWVIQNKILHTGELLPVSTTQLPHLPLTCRSKLTGELLPGSTASLTECWIGKSSSICNLPTHQSGAFSLCLPQQVCVVNVSVTYQVTGGEDDPLLRHQVQLANQVSLLQQLTAGQNAGSAVDAKSSVSESVSCAVNTVTSTAAATQVCVSQCN